MPTFDLGELGWSSELADNLEPGLVPARVSAAHRAAFDVHTADGVVRTRLPGRLVHDNADVAVGDWVGLGDGLIRTVLPRRSAIVRNAAGMATRAQTLAANVDLAFVVSSLGPELEPRRIERYLVTIWESGATPEIVLTKADRLEDPWPLVAEVEAVALGVSVHVVSALTGQGCDALRARLQPGTTAVLLGSSGVGKSTLVNRFAGHELMVVNETRVDDDEGRHTTSHRELILLPGGGLVIDTPGLRELQLWDGGGSRRDVRRRRGAGRRLPLQRLLAHARTRLRRARRGRVGRAPARALPQLAQAPEGVACDRNPPRRPPAQGGGAQVAPARQGGQGPSEEPMRTRRLQLVPLTVETGRRVLAGDLSGLETAEGWPHEDTLDAIRTAVGRRPAIARLAGDARRSRDRRLRHRRPPASRR